MTPRPWELVEPARVFDSDRPVALAILGRQARLHDADVEGGLPPALRPQWRGLLQDLRAGDEAASTTTWIGTDTPTRVTVGVLPDVASRHNAAARPDQVTALVRDVTRGSRVPVHVLVAASGADEVLAYTIAATRARPTYSRKSIGPAPEVYLAFATPPHASPPAATLTALRDAVSRAMYWQDQPAAELTVDAFVEQAVTAARRVGASVDVLRGEELARAGLGDLWGVGRAASQPPALVVLSRSPAASTDRTRRLVWAGKGIVFDSGGLSLKRPRDMRGMKADMSGAAAVLSAFLAASALDAPDYLHAVLCIAENAIGRDALRPDDVVEMHSGKTVEIADTDCEGRLVLADGVSYAVSRFQPDVVVDLATLTDSAVVATGHYHAAVVSNREALERQAVAAGRALGELVHPVPYVPEFARGPLASDIADLRNATTSTAAGTSVAAQFIAEHLGPFEGAWLHVDMEGPARSAQGRGTGYGVGLLLRTFGYL